MKYLDSFLQETEIPPVPLEWAPDKTRQKGAESPRTPRAGTRQNPPKGLLSVLSVPRPSYTGENGQSHASGKYLDAFLRGAEVEILKPESPNPPKVVDNTGDSPAKNLFSPAKAEEAKSQPQATPPSKASKAADITGFPPAPADALPSSGLPAEADKKKWGLRARLGNCPRCSNPWCWQSPKGWVCTLPTANRQPARATPQRPRPAKKAASDNLWQPQQSELCEKCGDPTCWLTPQGQRCLLTPRDQEEVRPRSPKDLQSPPVGLPPWKAPDEIESGYWTRQCDETLEAWRGKDRGPCPACDQTDWYEIDGLHFCGTCIPPHPEGRFHRCPECEQVMAVRFARCPACERKAAQEVAL